MRSTWNYSLKAKLAIFTQVFVSKLSLLYFRYLNSRRITFVRKGGIGDAILSTPALNEFKNKHPQTDIRLITPYRQVFSSNFDIKPKPSFRHFPIVWLMYEHYDFTLFRRGNIHIKSIIATFLGLKVPLDQLISSIQEDRGVEKAFKHKHQLSEPYLVIQPNSGPWFKAKDWQTKEWRSLVTLLNKDGFRVFQTGVQSDEYVEGTIDLRGRTSIEEAIYLIKNAYFFFGINSFGEQVAAHYRVPSIILYGPTNPIYSLNEGQWAIFEDNCYSYRELKKEYYFPDTSQIKSDYVYNRFLEKTKDL